MKNKYLLTALLIGAALVLPGCGKQDEEKAISLAEGFVARYPVEGHVSSDATEGGVLNGAGSDALSVAEEDALSLAEGDALNGSGEEPVETMQTENDAVSDGAGSDTAAEDGNQAGQGTDAKAEGNSGRGNAPAVAATGNEKTDYNVEIVKLTGVESNISITYPVISCWKDKEKEAYWNDVFFEAAASECRQAKSGDFVSMEASVANQNEKMCSIVVTGEEDWEGSAHPYGYCTTYNIDMESGEALALADFADTGQLADTLLSGEGCKVRTKGLSMDDIFNYNFKNKKPTKQGIAKNLAVFDQSYEALRSDASGGYEMLGSSFIDDGTLTLVFDVNHAMGDYVWVTVE